MSKVRLSPALVLLFLSGVILAVGTAAVQLNRPVQAAANGVAMTPTGGAMTPTVEMTPTAEATAPISITVTAEVYLGIVRRDPLPTPTATATPPAGYEAVDPQRENDVIAQIDQERTNSGMGLTSLAVEPQLVQSARRHSDDMAANNNTSHTGTDGSTARMRIEEAGYDPAWHGEIIAWGFPDAAGAMGWWMNSPTHRSIILSSEGRDLGVGYGASASNFGHYWVVNVGRRSGAADRTEGLVLCTVVLGNAERGSSATFWSPPPCPSDD